ncbi:MAG: hypothetical protein K0Q49_2522 [Haloplasmataceae bacterium]|nr:hypothetical protein [Haloplasmataceae bacterium]
MGDTKKSNDKLTIIINDKYLKTCFPYRVPLHYDSDELFVGAIKQLIDSGKSCKFLGFNELGRHVVVLDGIKYYSGKGLCDIETLNYLTFVIVNDAEHDFSENFFTIRAKDILDLLNKY